MRPTVIAIATLLGSASQAHAFCGFYVGGAGAEMFNNATEVVLMRHGTTTVLSMQNNYQGPPDHFALVVPVPTVIKESQVKTLPRELFGKVDTLGAPRLVEYWEQDPCMVEPDFEFDSVKSSVRMMARFSTSISGRIGIAASSSYGLECPRRSDADE